MGNKRLAEGSNEQTKTSQKNRFQETPRAPQPPQEEITGKDIPIRRATSLYRLPVCAGRGR